HDLGRLGEGNRTIGAGAPFPTGDGGGRFGRARAPIVRPVASVARPAPAGPDEDAARSTDNRDPTQQRTFPHESLRRTGVHGWAIRRHDLRHPAPELQTAAWRRQAWIGSPKLGRKCVECTRPARRLAPHLPPTSRLVL